MRTVALHAEREVVERSALHTQYSRSNRRPGLSGAYTAKTKPSDRGLELHTAPR